MQWIFCYPDPCPDTHQYTDPDHNTHVYSNRHTYSYSDSDLSPTPTPTPIQSLTGPVSSSAVAVSPDGSIVAAVNPDSDSITLVAADTLEVLREVPVGHDPRTVVFTPDSRLVLVANTGH